MKRTVLLVDDEPNILESLVPVLRADGYNLLTARSGNAALKLLADTPVHVIVSDQRMPEMTGIQLLRQVKKQFPSVVRVVLSGHPDLDDALNAINQGEVYKFITKPCPPHLLRAHIREAFTYYAQRAENERLKQELQALNQGLQEQVATKTHELLRTAQRLQVTLTQTIEALALTVEKRDPYTAGHQHRVAMLAAAIAAKMGLDDDRTMGLRLGATVHDIGKIYIPAEILNRPGQLTAPELALTKTHPEVGFDIMKGVQFPWPIKEMILQHHERLDGSGYPRGLKGDAITLEARIIAVADLVEAMTSHRPYRPALPLSMALDEINTGRGVSYDGDIVDCCTSILQDQASLSTTDQGIVDSAFPWLPTWMLPGAPEGHPSENPRSSRS